MSKTYLPYDSDQQLLLPAALQEWLPDDHLAYFISDVVDQLELSDITAHRPAAPLGHCLSGAGGEQHSGFPHHLRLSQGPPSGANGPVSPSAGVVPAGGDD